MPTRMIGQGFGLVAILYVVVVGYFMYMAGKIASSLGKMAATLEQIRAEQAARRTQSQG